MYYSGFDYIKYCWTLFFASSEPSSHRVTVLRIAAEPEPMMTSIKVREPATEPATWKNAADSESVERSSAPCIVAEGELNIQLGLLDMEGDLIDWETDLEIELAHLLSPSSPLVPSSPLFLVPLPSPEAAPDPPVAAPRKCPPVPTPRKSPPSYPLQPPPPLSSGSPSARPQPTINAVRAWRDCHPPALPWLEFPLISASSHEARTRPLPVDPPSPPWLLAPSSLSWPICPLALLGTLVPPAPPCSASTNLRLGTSLLRLRLVPSSLWLRQAPSSPQLKLSPLSLRLHRGHLDPHLRLGRRRHLLRLGLLLHLLRRRWPAPWSRRPSLLHGSSLHQLHRGPLSWLWPGSCSVPPAPGPSCLFPGSSLLRRLHGLCLPAPSRAPVLLLSLLPSSLMPFPFGWYYGTSTHLPGGGRYVRTILCVLLTMCFL